MRGQSKSGILVGEWYYFATDPEQESIFRFLPVGLIAAILVYLRAWEA